MVLTVCFIFVVCHYYPKTASPLATFLLPLLFLINEKITVNLHYCSLGDTGIKILMQSLCRNLDPHTEITGHLDMHIDRNGITGEGASYIAEALKTTRALRKLNLRGDRISDKGLQYIVEALITNTSLIELRLGGCFLKITEENGPALTEMLQRNKTLRKVDLSGNKDVPDNAASFIIEGLKKNTTLKTLNLWRCSITDEGVCMIRSSTSTCKIINYYQY